MLRPSFASTAIPVSAQSFNALARHLQDRYRIVAPDVRGHGESAWSPDGAYRYGDQSGDLAAFVDRLELKSYTLIGTSMGGIISMVYAAEHGGRLNGLVLNDIGPDAEPGTQRITQSVQARPDQLATLRRRDGLSSRDLADPRGASAGGPARASAQRAQRRGGRKLEVADGPRLHHPVERSGSQQTRRFAPPPGSPWPRCDARPR